MKKSTQAGLAAFLMLMAGYLVLVLVGCQPAGEAENTLLQPGKDFDECVWFRRRGADVERCIDRELQTACWIYAGYGISCLPLEGR